MAPKLWVRGEELVATDAIECHPENPRSGDIGALAASIDHLGFFQVVGVQRSSRLVVYGNHRLRAARMTGMAEVPVVWLDVDDEQAREMAIVDNRSSDLSGWHEDVLLSALEKADADGRLAVLMFTDDDLVALRKLCDEPEPRGLDDYTPAPSPTVRVRIGPYGFAASAESMDAFVNDIESCTNGTIETIEQELRRRLCL